MTGGVGLEGGPLCELESLVTLNKFDEEKCILGEACV